MSISPSLPSAGDAYSDHALEPLWSGDCNSDKHLLIEAIDSLSPPRPDSITVEYVHCGEPMQEVISTSIGPNPRQPIHTMRCFCGFQIDT